jgi:hypothetical protein
MAIRLSQLRNISHFSINYNSLIRGCVKTKLNLDECSAKKLYTTPIMGYAWDRMNHICLLLLLLLQHSSLFSQLQLLGSCKQIGHIIVPQPTHVLSALLQPQCLQPLKETQLFTIKYIIFMVFGYKISLVIGLKISE